MDRTAAGRRAEEAAARYLASQGYTILERNFRSKIGEIDIIAEDKDYLVFIEVRSRQGIRFGMPQETVNWAKQQRVRRMASLYLQTHRKWKKYCRFDFLGVLFDENNEIKAIELIRDAF